MMVLSVPHDLFVVEQGMFDLVGIGLDELVNSLLVCRIIII